MKNLMVVLTTMMVTIFLAMMMAEAGRSPVTKEWVVNTQRSTTMAPPTSQAMMPPTQNPGVKTPRPPPTDHA
uniref:Uncharacterized protein n=1 Tax=Anopheles funestus TaxID=62324 RepID=A0A4Y0BEC6_ANOFN